MTSGDRPPGEQVFVCSITGFAGTFPLILLAAGCAALPPPKPVAANDPAVAVIERGWHTDIGLPADRLSGPLAQLAATSPGARYLVFGFGDRDFYMEREVTVGSTLTALFPGPGVVLVTGLRATPEAAFGAEHVVELKLRRADFDHVADFVWQTLETGDGAHRLADGPYPGSSFYASDRIYDGLDNCNGWTAVALQRGALPVDPDWVLFAGQVMNQARRAAAERAPK